MVSGEEEAERRRCCSYVCPARRVCTVVGPLYRDPRPAAQLLISSAAHQSLVHDHRLVKSRPPYRRNPATLASPRLSRRERDPGCGEAGGGTFRMYVEHRTPKCIEEPFSSLLFSFLLSLSDFPPRNGEPSSLVLLLSSW